MGLGGIHPGSLLLILAIVVVLFGTKKFRNIGSDLGAALRGFRKGMSDDADDSEPRLEADPPAEPAEPSKQKSHSEQ